MRRLTLARQRLLFPPTVTVAPFWKRRPIATTVITALALLAIFARGAAHNSDDQTKYNNRVFTVVQVVNAVTLEIDAPDRTREYTRVRLCGVDTEVQTRLDDGIARKDEAPAPLTDAPAAFVCETLLSRPVRILLTHERTRDEHGRLLAYVIIEETGECLNEMLLERGLACADPLLDHPQNSAYQQLERRAQRTAVGLWTTTPADSPLGTNSRE